MTVELILAAVVGFVAGILGALWWDSQTLVRRIQEANAAKQNAEAALQKFQIQHRAAMQKLETTEADLKTAVAERTQLEETIARQLAEIEASRGQLQESIDTNEALKENIEESQARLEEVEGLRLTAEEKLATAVAENQRLMGDVQLLEAEVTLLEEKIASLSEERTQAKTQIENLTQKVAAVEAQLASLDAEKAAAVVQLQQAELTIAELGVEIESLKGQLAKMEELRQALFAANEKLEASDDHLQTLQSKMDDVKTKMNYSGKNQLQLIRGIGPTYARRLNEFGIQTFADLAECDAEQVASIIRKKNWQSVNIQDWLDEAQALAATLGADGG